MNKLLLPFTCWVCRGDGGWYECCDDEGNHTPWEDCSYCHGRGRFGLIKWVQERLVEWRFG
jgi:hypothetical protein